MLPPAPPKPPELLPSDKSAPIAQIQHGGIVIPDMEEEGLSSDAVRRAQVQRQVKKYVVENPKEATQLIRNWMAEDTYGAKD